MSPEDDGVVLDPLVPARAPPAEDAGVAGSAVVVGAGVVVVTIVADIVVVGSVVAATVVVAREVVTTVVGVGGRPPVKPPPPRAIVVADVVVSGALTVISTGVEFALPLWLLSTTIPMTLYVPGLGKVMLLLLTTTPRPRASLTE